MASANKVKSNMAIKHYSKRLKILAFGSFKMRYNKLKRRQDKSKFKDELQELARKY